MDSDDLARQLEAEGQEDLADTLRQRRLAEQLRDQGHDGLAARLDGGPAEEPAEESEGDQFLAEVRAALTRGQVSTPGLLDE